MEQIKYPETKKEIEMLIMKFRSEEKNKHKSSMIGKIIIEVYNNDLICKGNAYSEKSNQE